VVVAASIGLLAGSSGVVAQTKRPPTTITMDELHKFGGVPPGWRFSPPAGDAAAGRQAFVELGCHGCHAVQGESFPKAAGDATRPGPELTGMGSHHPPDYFTESILNPNAVRIEGPGYLGTDGSSTMPSYPSMTVAQLTNLVAYLASLTGVEVGSAAHCAAPTANLAVVFFTQAFEVSGDKLDTFYTWFEQQGFREHPGLVSIQTYAGRRGQGNVVLTVFGFEAEPALQQFVAALDRQPKSTFLRPAERYLLRSPALYRVDGMSAKPDK